MTRLAPIALLAAIVFTASAEPSMWLPLFDGTSLKGWAETPFPAHGKVEIKDGIIALGKGRQTGINWKGDFPKSNYEIRFEAARIDGRDFFSGITFPVADSHCTWVNGGWGGSVVGLSNLDHDDASENDTSIVREFQQGRWYKFRLAVTENRIQAWIDEELVIDADIAGRHVALRPGDDDLSIPLGFSSYGTLAHLRKLEYRLIAART
jgi:hypothetical protein